MCFYNMLYCVFKVFFLSLERFSISLLKRLFKFIFYEASLLFGDSRMPSMPVKKL